MLEARANILGRLRNRPINPQATDAEAAATDIPLRNKSQRIEQFIARQEAAHGEAYWLQDGDWLGWLKKELPKRALHKALVGTGVVGQQMQAAVFADTELVSYTQPIEHWKTEFFQQVDVAITGCKGAIAETGSLILWPDQEEPRLMSLIPPVHIVLLHLDNLHNTFTDAIQADQWAEQMPTNALLISGPSKTADIEQTLVYGIHGPKQLITLMVG